MDCHLDPGANSIQIAPSDLLIHNNCADRTEGLELTRRLSLMKVVCGLERGLAGHLASETVQFMHRHPLATAALALSEKCLKVRPLNEPGPLAGVRSESALLDPTGYGTSVGPESIRRLPDRVDPVELYTMSREPPCHLVSPIGSGPDVF